MEHQQRRTDSNGCVMIDSVTVGFDVGTSELQIADDKLQIYPNPANETVTIVFRLTQHEIQEIVVSNLLGVQMMRLPRVEYNPRNDRYQEATIDISNLASGVYFLKVLMSDGGNAVSKFVKE